MGGGADLGSAFSILCNVGESKMTTPVRRAHAATLSVQEFEAQYVDTQTVLLLDGLQEPWPARTKWDASYFRSRFGELVVPVRAYGLGGDKPYAKQSMTLAAYLDYWEQLPVGSDSAPSPNLYLAEWNFVHQCPALLEDFATPEYFAPDWIDRLPANLQFGRLWIFIGHPAVDTPAHTDTFGTSAWLSMVRGTKSVRLIHPDSAHVVTKGIDLFSDEVEASLHAQNVVLYEAIITEGDTLFIPGRWFHQVKNLDKNIMVTKNFVDSANVLGFLSDFETRVLGPVRALRGLRNKFLADQIGSSGAARPDAPSCLHSPKFVEEQLQWADDVNVDIQHYRALLSALRDAGK